MGKGPTDFNFITPEDYIALCVRRGRKSDESLKELQSRVESDADCIVCGQPAWKLVGTDLCFTCTIGEADASDDYELRR